FCGYGSVTFTARYGELDDVEQE
ncbi:MAG: hypothetical protein QG574_1038, partial [Cyanobacteriota bacterium erpe_2018_sw_21hr_WHONDRS-SW48-000092_B_bin.40]|nr:hypothetical protein [Cyanobacteriota bacterium erpe_2018_sw_21hr_WHONDRS-SW48-000092_B_bin.40]